MNINLLIDNDFKNFISQDQIDKLTEKLNKLGFNPKVFHKLPSNLGNNYFLLFANLPIKLPENSENKIVYMTAGISSFKEVIEQHKFILIIEWIRYIKDFPLFCGEIIIAEKMGLKYIKTYKDGYCLIRNNNKSNLLEAIIDYIRAYNYVIIKSNNRSS